MTTKFAIPYVKGEVRKGTVIEKEESYDSRDTSEVENLYTKEDVIYWAEDVASMINEDDEHGDVITIDNDINNALEVLVSANEFLEEL